MQWTVELVEHNITLLVGCLVVRSLGRSVARMVDWLVGRLQHSCILLWIGRCAGH